MKVYNEAYVSGYAVRVEDPATRVAFIQSDSFRPRKYEAEERKRQIRRWFAKSTKLTVVRVTGRVEFRPEA